MALETDPRGQHAARRLRELRAELGVSRETLLARLQADPEIACPWATTQSIGMVEKGANRFPFDLAPAICRALDVPLPDLIGYDEPFVRAEIERANADAADRAAAIVSSAARIRAYRASES